MESRDIKNFRERVRKELFGNIVPFWIIHTMDKEFGGFFGRISNDLKVEKEAQKSLILIARIVWTFSALFRFEQKPEYLRMAKHGYDFLIDKFLDNKYGGTYWLVDYEGSVLVALKKIYGQAFSIYAFVEYYSATREQDALDNAIQIYELIEKNNYDKENQGYMEAANRDWSTTEEMRLSEVDMNEVKSMNTHLHLMEAYTSLYRVWKDEGLKAKLEELINVFINHIIDPETLHLKLFFDEVWNVKSKSVSFGHDIEAGWLLCEAVDVLENSVLKEKVHSLILKMADVTLKEGFSEQTAIYTEMDGDGSLDKNIQWWPQSEAVVGLLNAFDVSGHELYLFQAEKAWKFIESNFVDKKFGEWFYEVDNNNSPVKELNKVSEWKGPYHNSRACIEILKRLV